MSRAFVREDDLNPEPVRAAPPPLLPPGAKNYLTPEGAERLRGELAELSEKRSPLISTGADPDAKRQAQIIEQRIRYLQQSLRSAEIVATVPGPVDQVRFGATVTVRDHGGVETRYRIVGVDESDADRGEVSWLSPLAQALLNARRGEHIRVKVPRGEIDLEVLQIQ